MQQCNDTKASNHKVNTQIAMRDVCSDTGGAEKHWQTYASAHNTHNTRCCSSLIYYRVRVDGSTGCAGAELCDHGSVLVLWKHLKTSRMVADVGDRHKLGVRVPQEAVAEGNLQEQTYGRQRRLSIAVLWRLSECSVKRGD